MSNHKEATTTLNLPTDITHGANYSVVQAGPMDQLDQYDLVHPKFGVVRPGKLFVQELIKATGAEVSLNKMAPGKSVPFSHAHKTNEELYIFTAGHGQMVLDGQVIEVKEGTVVRVAPGAARCWRNNSQEDLYFIVIQATENSLGEHTFDDGYEVKQELPW